MKKLLAVLMLLGTLAAAGLWWELQRPVHLASDPPQTVLIEQGTSVSGIGAALQRVGVVRHPLLFRLAVLARGDAAKLRAGEYAIEGAMTLDDVIDKMVRGDVVRRAVTFPEGRNLDEMASIVGQHGLSAGAFLAAAKDAAPIRDLDPTATDLEGYVFPDTYDIPRSPTPEAAIVQQGVKRFREVLAAEQARIAKSTMSLREIVTLASVVELETARPEERPRIASVFLNRLRIGMPLQTDPTVIYALRRAGTWDGNIRKGDLDIDSPYNTYRRAGLPPGPIASPGREAIRAVVEPEATRDLYFVSRNDGSHHFSATLDEHSRAVNYYQRRRGAPPSAQPLTPAAPASPPPG
jgi:UPF0755 protein